LIDISDVRKREKKTMEGRWDGDMVRRDKQMMIAGGI
jgi:hypothetical protein